MIPLDTHNHYINPTIKCFKFRKIKKRSGCVNLSFFLQKIKKKKRCSINNSQKDKTSSNLSIAYNYASHPPFPPRRTSPTMLSFVFQAKSTRPKKKYMVKIQLTRKRKMSLDVSCTSDRMEQIFRKNLTVTMAQEHQFEPEDFLIDHAF